jgi:hypothetical protein
MPLFSIANCKMAVQKSQDPQVMIDVVASFEIPNEIASDCYHGMYLNRAFQGSP